MADKHKILIVEDDKYIINFISMSLKKEDYDYVIAKTCGEANALFYANRPDMIILDLGLPDGDGIEIIKNVREISKIPIIVVSARQEEEEKIQALDLGADDYVTKPFSLAILRARIANLIRNHTRREQAVYERSRYEDEHLYLDTRGWEFKKDGQEIILSRTEQKLLGILLENRGNTVPRERMLEKIWQDGAEYVEENALSVAVSRLRAKVEEDPSKPRHILNVYGIGYVWK